MNVIAVDPGVRASGVAVFEDDRLVRAVLVRAAGLTQMVTRIREEIVVERSGVLIIERPTVYRQGGKGDANDLVSVAIVAGAFAAGIDPGVWGLTKFVEPRTWKGSVPKKVHNARIVGRLSTEERKVLDACGATGSLKHNVIDAIGIGLYQIGR